MKKIQIQFSESDEKVYHDYCLRYYQAHDFTRKQTISAFLDLYEKEVLPLREQDLKETRQFLSRKCDDLKKEDGGTEAGSDGRLKVCTDLVQFTDDLEKMYRLLQKQGVTANYLMVLAAFARIIEESRSAPAVENYKIRPDAIAALADPLVGTIRARLGTDRQWQSVLRELSFIAARYNQIYTEPKFDLEILQLIGPSVVSHFNKDVGAKEIQSRLQDFFAESELDEFESFLNQTPAVLKEEQEADISWDAIIPPLKELAGLVQVQREKMSSVRSTIADTSAMVSEAAVPVSAPAVQPPAAPPAAPAPAALPEALPPVVNTGALVARIRPFTPVIIGAVIILLFIVGTVVMTSGGSLFAGNTTNTSAKNVTVVKTTAKPATTTAKPAANATTAKPAATTAKPGTTTAKPTVVSVTTTPTPKVYSAADIGNHLVEIAFGPDNNVINKPVKDRISVSVTGAHTQSDIDSLNEFIKQFNVYSSSTKISEGVEFDHNSDIYLDFLPREGMAVIKGQKNVTEVKDVDTGEFLFVKSDGKTYVNADMNGVARKRWVLRAVLMNLGFYGETAKYSDSLFYAGANSAIKLSDIDVKALQLMYGKKVTNGMSKASVKALY